ncbi:hypothetical protein [Pseudoduganella violacea]|uniref:Uncharacterized protein n=1 Tax=Pseudoduganella violacea TaxID=1715466 RepID=A0A7W5FTN4_9BURK|nr:hypothetical protein [Pseudoduganella violacea]MBB3118358.1 hypothetical protein [Pseudoduganella violacea]
MKTRPAQPQLFAFKLAGQKAAPAKPQAQWQVRQGVAIAGCSAPIERTRNRMGGDSGVYC